MSSTIGLKQWCLLLKQFLFSNFLQWQSIFDLLFFFNVQTCSCIFPSTKQFEMRSQSGYAACSIPKCTWHVRNCSFDFQKILILSQMPTSMKITSWNIKILYHSTILKYDTFLAVCLGDFQAGNRCLALSLCLLLTPVLCHCEILVKMAPCAISQETFPFFFGPRKIKASYSYTALSFTSLKSIRYSSVYFFNVLYSNSLINFGLSQLKGKPLIKGSCGTVRIKQRTFRELVKTS